MGSAYGSYYYFRELQQNMKVKSCGMIPTIPIVRKLVAGPSQWKIVMALLLVVAGHIFLVSI